MILLFNFNLIEAQWDYLTMTFTSCGAVLPGIGKIKSNVKKRVVDLTQGFNVPL